MAVPTGGEAGLTPMEGEEAGLTISQERARLVAGGGGRGTRAGFRGKGDVEIGPVEAAAEGVVAWKTAGEGRGERHHKGK